MNAAAGETLLGLDVGERRIGVAVCLPGMHTAVPLETVERSSVKRDVGILCAIARKRCATTVIVGIPLGIDGSEGAQAGRVRAFANRLSQAGLHVAFLDERLSSVQASRQPDARILREKRLTDQAAAQILLQAYVDRHVSAQTADAGNGAQ